MGPQGELGPARMSDAATARRALACLDLTDLADNCSEGAIFALCKRARTRHGPVAAICIWPRFVGDAARLLAESGIKIATVINFPQGGDNIERAIADTHEALRDGADEIDLVMPYHAFLRGDAEGASQMIAAVAAELSEQHVLKVILETGALGSGDNIAAASRLAIAAGADFLKTSTGKIATSATPEAAEIMLAQIKASEQAVGFKASGGVRSVADAALYLGLADRAMGAGWAGPETFRLGASALLDALLAAIDGEAAPTPGGAY